VRGRPGPDETHGAQHEPGGDRQPVAGATQHPDRRRRDGDHADRARGQQRAGRQCAQPEPVLRVQRHQRREAEHRAAVQEVQQVHGAEAAPGQEAQRDERRRGLGRVPDERGRADEGYALGQQEVDAQRCAVGPAKVADAEHGGQQRDAEQHDATDVQVRVRALRDVRDHHRAEHEQHQADRQVDKEDAAPGPVGHEHPAQHRADDAAYREDAREQAERTVPAGPEPVGDDPGRRRHECAAADRLDRPEHDEQVDVVGQTAAHGRGREQDDCAEEDLLAAVLVAELPGQRHHEYLAERVDRDGPGAPVDLGVQVALDGRQRRRDDGLVDRGHEQRDRDRGEQQNSPASRLTGDRLASGVDLR
jgi:hypothetical protein